jgi:DEAD/DEAH box helicase domain-containing protein
VGLSEPLWTRQRELVERASELVERCDCRAGCPACVGPVLAADEERDGVTSPKALARRVLTLLAKPSESLAQGDATAALERRA